VQFNKQQPTSIDVAPWLEPDLRLIERTLQVGFFHYAPRLWMVGEVEPLKALQEPSTRAEVISRILNEYPGRILNTDECFYRLRKAPAHPDDFREYDPPPNEKLGEGRFDTAELPILYGSQDLEVCLHECRVAADDEVYIATLVPLRRLRLLNLAEALWEEHVSEFESLDMALHMLLLAGRHSYEISREIASAAHKCGFDGLVYPSYFTLLRTGATPFETTFGISHRRFPGFREHARKNTISNLALFGRPVADGSVTVRCTNRVILNKVEYNLHFGPLLVHGANSNATAPPNSSQTP
jgi:RES domain